MKRCWLFAGTAALLLACVGESRTIAVKRQHQTCTKRTFATLVSVAPSPFPDREYLNLVLHTVHGDVTMEREVCGYA